MSEGFPDPAALPRTPLKVLALCTQFGGLGGIESVVRDHHRQDPGQGLQSRFVVFWEPDQPGWEDARFLDFDDGMRIREARRRVAEAVHDFRPDLVLYHTVWGWPYFDDLLGQSPRILYLHSDTPGLDAQLATRAWWADGFACVNDLIADRVRRARPGVPEDRIHRVHYPVEVPIPLPPPARPFSRPLVIGICGRLEVEQKRMDRIPELAALLDAAGIPYRMEFLGDGSERGRLESRLSDRSRFAFLGRKSGAEYWRILSGWDAILFVSDYEGTPIALLEAMTAGVVPLHPRIGCGGDAYASQVREDLAYPAGDMPALVEVLQKLGGEDPIAAARLRARSAEVVSGHAAVGYRTSMARFFRQVATQPRMEHRPLPRRRFPTDWLTFRQTRNLMDLRRRWSS
jgi:glycosyltransferase involved in cell wall biosynthesis